MIYISLNLSFHSDHFSSKWWQAQVTLFYYWRGPVPSSSLPREENFDPANFSTTTDMTLAVFNPNIISNPQTACPLCLVPCSRKRKNDWTEKIKHCTIETNINKIKNIKKITQNQTPWTLALCQSFLCLDATSSVTLLPLLLNTCSQGTEREASLTPVYHAQLCHNTTASVLQMIQEGPTKRNCTRQIPEPAVVQNLELLSASSLLLLADALSDLGNLPFFFAKEHTLFCKYMNTEIKKLEDQIIVNSSQVDCKCQVNREIGIVLGLSIVLLYNLVKYEMKLLNNKQNISEIRKTFLWVQDQEQSESPFPQQHQWLSDMIFNKSYKKLWQNQSLKINDRKWHRKERERNYSSHSWFSSVPYQFQVAVLESSFNLSQLSQLHSSAIKNWDIFTLIASTLLRQQENHRRFLAIDLLIDLCQTPLLCHDSICQGSLLHINYLKTPASPSILYH